MPFKTTFVMPEVFMRYKGVKVYHVYCDDDVDQGPLDFTYTLDPEHNESEPTAFDVRDLSTCIDKRAPDIKTIKQAIRWALDSGEVKPEDEQ